MSVYDSSRIDIGVLATKAIVLSRNIKAQWLRAWIQSLDHLGSSLWTNPLASLWLSFSIWQMLIQIIAIHTLESCCDDWMSSYIIKVTYHCFTLWELKSPSSQPWLLYGLLKNLSIIIHMQCVWEKMPFWVLKGVLVPLIIGWLQSNQNFTLKLATPATQKITETPSFIQGALSENLHPCSKILEIRMDNWDSGWSRVNKDTLIKFCIGIN